MTNYDLTTLPTDTAIKLVMKDFGFSRTEAAHFVSLAQGHILNDVATTKAKKPKLGTGKRFAQLKGKLAAKGATNPGALAAFIGRKKFGAKKFGKLSAHGRKEAKFGGLGNTTFGAGNKKTGSLNLTRTSNIKGNKRTGSLGNTNTGAGNKKTGAIGNTMFGPGSKKTGSLGLTRFATMAIPAGSVNQPAKNNKGQRFFPAGRGIGLLLGKGTHQKGYDPKA